MLNSALNKLQEISESNIRFLIGSIQIGEGPYESRSKEDFKNLIRFKIQEFREKHSILIPLLHPIGVTIFYTLQENKYNRSDLDNLARVIVPILTQIMMPPKAFCTELDYSRDPKDKILNYQIVCIKRNPSTPKGGEISFIITNGYSFNQDIWSKVNSKI